MSLYIAVFVDDAALVKKFYTEPLFQGLDDSLATVRNEKYFLGKKEASCLHIGK